MIVTGQANKREEIKGLKRNFKKPQKKVWRLKKKNLHLQPLSEQVLVITGQELGAKKRDCKIEFFENNVKRKGQEKKRYSKNTLR